MYVLLLDMSLEGGDLFVDSGNILLNYVCEFLWLWSLLGKSPVKGSSAYANFHGAIVEQGLPFSDLWSTVSKEEIGTGTACSR